MNSSILLGHRLWKAKVIQEIHLLCERCHRRVFLQKLPHVLDSKIKSFSPINMGKMKPCLRLSNSPCSKHWLLRYSPILCRFPRHSLALHDSLAALWFLPSPQHGAREQHKTQREAGVARESVQSRGAEQDPARKLPAALGKGRRSSRASGTAGAQMARGQAQREADTRREDTGDQSEGWQGTSGE